MVSCAVCSNNAAFHCSKCLARAYCGQDCQRADWKSHSQSCGKKSAEEPTAVVAESGYSNDPHAAPFAKKEERGLAPVGVSISEISSDPSLEEYEKLKRTTALMVQFYVNGTLKKFDQLESVRDEIEKAKFDLGVAREQLKALEPFGERLPEIKQPDPRQMGNANAQSQEEEKCPVDHESLAAQGEKPEGYQIDGCPVSHLNKNPTVVRVRQHPRMLEYQKTLLEEEKALEEEIVRLTAAEQDYEGLWKWSQSVVRAIKWVEAHQEEYCNQKLGLNLPLTEKSEISEEDRQVFRKALKEIHFNLDESLDFFHASLDGRLAKYHEIEKALIEAQLEVVHRFAAEHTTPRIMHVLSEIGKDFEYLKGQMNVTEDTIMRRQKMTRMHTEFFDLLNWQQAVLNTI